MKTISRRAASLGAGLALLFVSALAAPAAMAADGTANATGSTQSEVGVQRELPDGSKVTVLAASSVKLSSTAYRVLNSTPYALASCGAGAGGTCSINTTASATRTIETSLGVTRATVAASIGISSASTVSLGVSCNSPVFSNSGQRYTAFPAGTMYYYTISSGGQTSGILSAFNPTGIACYMR